MTTNWETIDVPRGAFISWGTQPGQHVTGKVLTYEPGGGTDFNGNAVPQLAVELVEAAASINKEGDRTDFPAGELVVLNCGQVSLKRAVVAAALNPGDLVKITLENLARTSNGTVKEFGIKVARGAGGTATPKTASKEDPWAAQAPQPKDAWADIPKPQAKPPF